MQDLAEWNHMTRLDPLYLHDKKQDKMIIGTTPTKKSSFHLKIAWCTYKKIDFEQFYFLSTLGGDRRTNSFASAMVNNQNERFDIAKSRSDKREYRGLQLPNRMKVILSNWCWIF